MICILPYKITVTILLKTLANKYSRLSPMNKTCSILHTKYLHELDIQSTKSVTCATETRCKEQNVNCCYLLGRYKAIDGEWLFLVGWRSDLSG